MKRTLTIEEKKENLKKRIEYFESINAPRIWIEKFQNDLAKLENN